MKADNIAHAYDDLMEFYFNELFTHYVIFFFNFNQLHQNDN